MKYAREMKVGALSLLCLFLLFFGFHYLKGVNIFSPVNGYHGKYMQMNGLKEQAPVYIRGYKVGQVDHIHYDFTADTSFVVDISIDKHISLPRGTQMAIVADGLLGGMAVELQVPLNSANIEAYADGAWLPTLIVPSLMETIQTTLLASLSETVNHVNEVVEQLQSQLDNDHISNVLANVDDLTRDLKSSSANLKKLMDGRVPQVVEHVDLVVEDLGKITTSLREADIVGKVDSTVVNVNGLVDEIKSTNGTIGKLINDNELYTNINNTVVSADSLLVDLKAHPKRYVHFSIFGKKDK